MLFAAVLLALPLLIQKRTTVALDEPEAVAPFVLARRHTT